MVAYCTQMFNLNRLEAPTPISTFVAQTQIIVLSCLCVCLAASIVAFEGLSKDHGGTFASSFVPVVITCSCLIGNLCKRPYKALSPENQNWYIDDVFVFPIHKFFYFRLLYVMHQFATKFTTKLKFQSSTCSPASNRICFYQYISHVKIINHHMDSIHHLDVNWISNIRMLWVAKLIGGV